MESNNSESQRPPSSGERLDRNASDQQNDASKEGRGKTQQSRGTGGAGSATKEELAAAHEALKVSRERKGRTRLLVAASRRNMEDLGRLMEVARVENEEAERCDREADEEVGRATETVEQVELRRRPCQWNAMYDELVAYKEEHGDTLVPHPHRTKKNPALDPLGRWVGNQRVFYKYYMNGDTKHIKPHRIAALNRIGFVWDVNEYKWNKYYSQLVQYKDVHGDCRVPRTYPANQELANWVRFQRTAWLRHIKEQPSTLSAERIAMLQYISFDFVADVPTGDSNKSRKKKKEEAKRANEDAAAKVEESVEGGAAVSTPEAESLFPSSKLAGDEFWEKSYQALVDFHAKHGHCQVSNRSIARTKGYGYLTKWTAQQKREYIKHLEGKPSILNPERISMLESLNFPFRKPVSEARKSTGATSNVRKRQRL